MKRTGQPKTKSPTLLAAILRRGAGVHKDQKTKKDPKVLRRDKSYKEAS